jgi:hypothetical protein
MSDMILLGTRKGTVIFDRVNATWRPRPIEHAGIPVCYAARDPRDGTPLGFPGSRPLGPQAVALA